jgi:hypothetical protein
MMDEVPELETCGEPQIKNKVRHLRKKYTETSEWKKNTGQGVLEQDGEVAFQGKDKY